MAKKAIPFLKLIVSSNRGARGPGAPGESRSTLARTAEEASSLGLPVMSRVERQGKRPAGHDPSGLATGRHRAAGLERIGASGGCSPSGKGVSLPTAPGQINAALRSPVSPLPERYFGDPGGLLVPQPSHPAGHLGEQP